MVATLVNDIHAGPLIGAIQNVIQPVGAREVLRCAQCHLVQFRTASDLCRKCNRPLPRPLEFADVASMEEEKAGGIAADRTMPVCPIVCHGKTIKNFSLGPRLRELRESGNLTQAEIARKASVPRTYVSRIEHGHLLPGLGVTQRLADALGVGILDLVPNANGENEAFSGDPYWTSLALHFSQLQIEEQALVLTRVQAMVRHRQMSAA